MSLRFPLSLQLLARDPLHTDVIGVVGVEDSVGRDSVVRYRQGCGGSSFLIGGGLGSLSTSYSTPLLCLQYGDSPTLGIRPGIQAPRCSGNIVSD